MRASSRFLVLLLGLTLALAGLLAVEALRATRSHRVTAERALRDYATVAAWEFLSAADEEIERRADLALGPVAGSPSASPYDSLPSAAALSPAADSLLPCGPADSSRFAFAFDLRNGVLTTDGTDPASARRAWLADTIAAEARSGTLRSGRYRVVWGPDQGAGTGALVVYAVKMVRSSGYAAHDAPLAAYGVVSCAGAFAPLLAAVLDRQPLLPAPVAGGLPNTKLVSLEVSDPEGHPLFRSGPPVAPDNYAGDPASRPGSIVIRASLPPDVAGRLVVARPGARLPLLVGLLVLTAGLTAVGARQLRQEQELVRLRNDFTSSVSHELRTPLTQILLFGETLELGRARNEDERRQALAIIVQEARRLAHLVENVLHLSRAERRLIRVNPMLTPLAALLREIVERFAPLAGTAAVRIRTELDEALAVIVDSEALHQVVINLLDNAVKYGGGGPVTLRATFSEGWARIEVEDAGAGVPAGDRLRIWEPFVRLRPDARIPGSGIGLAVVRELVAAHGGECRVEEAVGGGSRFVVELPGARRIELPPASASRPDPVEVSWPAS